MSLPIILRLAAKVDMAEARDWYEQHKPGLGQEFLDAVDATLDRIRQSPESYAKRYKGVRPAGLRRFPYVVYYRVLDTCVEVLGVVHGSRSSKAWRSRA